MNKIGTKCVQEGWKPKSGEPRVLPLYQSTTFLYETAEEMAYLFDHPADGHLYSRISNPTVDCLEKKIAALEGGVAALGTSAGLAAETLAILNVCHQGDNFLTASTVYGGTYNLFNVTLRRYGIDARFFDPTAPAEDIEKLIDDNTKLIYCESIANPAMVVADFDKYSKIAKKYGILFVVDNTLTTPVLCRPIEHGADIVIHATTKYIDGHAQCVGGMIVDSGKFEFENNPRFEIFNKPDESYHGLVYSKDCKGFAYIFKARAQMMRDFACCMNAFGAYITNLGCETLHLRMKQHSQNALAVAQLLEGSDKVEWVKYPGLKSDENYALAQKYFDGGLSSGMVTFGIKGGKDAAMAFQKNLKLFGIVTHIADARSCVLHPASTTHRQLSESDLKAAGISDSLIRLSVGIEDTEDILADIKQALNF